MSSSSSSLLSFCHYHYHLSSPMHDSQSIRWEECERDCCVNLLPTSCIDRNRTEWMDTETVDLLWKLVRVPHIQKKGVVCLSVSPLQIALSLLSIHVCLFPIKCVFHSARTIGCCSAGRTHRDEHVDIQLSTCTLRGWEPSLVFQMVSTYKIGNGFINI